MFFNPFMPGNASQMNMMNAMNQLRSNPVNAIRQAGYNVPDEIAGDPQAVVMHLIQTGQVGGQAMQWLQPMLRNMAGQK